MWCCLLQEAHEQEVEPTSKDPPNQFHELVDGRIDVLVPALSVLPPSQRPASKRDNSRLLPQRDTTDTTRESAGEVRIVDEAAVQEVGSLASSQQRASVGCPCGSPCDVIVCLPKRGDTPTQVAKAANTPDSDKMQLIAGGSSQLPLPVFMPEPSLVSPMRSRSPARGGRSSQPCGTPLPLANEKQPRMPSAVRVYTPWIVVHEPRKVRPSRISWFENDAGASMASRWTEGVVECTGGESASGHGAMQMRSMAREGSQGSDRCRGRHSSMMRPVLWRNPLPEGMLGVTSTMPWTDSVTADSQESSEESTGIPVGDSCTSINVIEAQQSCTTTLSTEIVDEAAGPATPGTVGAVAGTDARAAAAAEAPYCGTLPHKHRQVMPDETAEKGHLSRFASSRYVIPGGISHSRLETHVQRAAGHSERCGSLVHFVPGCLYPCLVFLGRNRPQQNSSQHVQTWLL